MIERKTITIETAAGPVEINEYMTGGEVLEFEEVESSGSKIKAAEKLIELMVVSVAGETDREKVKAAVKDMPAQDFSRIIFKIKDLVSGIEPEDSKK